MGIRVFRATIVILISSLTLLSAACGEEKKSNSENTDSSVEISAEDLQMYLPEDFSVQNWKKTDDGVVFAVAKESEESVAHILLIKTNNFARVSKPFPALAVDFGDGKSWGVKLDDDTLGYAVAIDMGTGDIPGYFVKVFEGNTFTEVLCDLGKGYVARDFFDLDGTGYANLLMINIKWADASPDIVSGQPFTQAVCKYENGKFVDDTPNHTNQMSPGLKQFKSGVANAGNEADALYYAINLMITMDAMGNRSDAIDGFTMIPGQLSDEKNISFAEEIVEHINNLSEDDPLNPPWFNLGLEPAWIPFQFETFEVKE